MDGPIERIRQYEHFSSSNRDGRINLHSELFNFYKTEHKKLRFSNKTTKITIQIVKHNEVHCSNPDRRGTKNG